MRRFAVSCAVAIVTNARRQSIVVRALLLIAVTPFDDRKLNLIRRFETDQTDLRFGRLIAPGGHCIDVGARRLPAISFAIDDTSYDSFADRFLRHRYLNRFGHDDWLRRGYWATRIYRERE